MWKLTEGEIFPHLELVGQGDFHWQKIGAAEFRVDMDGIGGTNYLGKLLQFLDMNGIDSQP